MALRTVPTGIAAVGLLIALAVSPAGAQVPIFEGEEVIVAGKRRQRVATTAAYVTVIPRQELQRMGFTTLADALQFLAEVYVRTAGAGPGGLTQASIRGSTPQQVLVLIDGVPLNATAQFGVNLSTISLADVERVEVLRGPYSAIHGSGGAVIQVVTRADARPLAFAGTGSHGTFQGTLRFGGSSSMGSYSFGGQYLTTRGDRPNADATRWTGNARFTLGVDPRTAVTLAVHSTSAESGVPGSTLFPSPLDRLGDGRTIFSLTWARSGSDGPEQQLRLWWLGDRLRFQSPGFVSDSQGSAFGGEWQQVRRLGRGGILTWGVEWQHARFRYSDVSIFGSTAFQPAGTTAAGYLQYDVPRGEKTLIGLGLRYDVHSVYGSRLNPRAGFVHFLTPDLRLRGGVGRTFRGPTFGELFFPGCSNSMLRPEDAWQADLGLERSLRPELLLRLNGFYTDAQNLIIGGCSPRNIGSARVAGLSADVVGRLTDQWLVSGNLTWTSGVDRTTGLSLLRLPTWQANLILRHAMQAGTTISLLANYVSERADLDFSTFPATRVTLPGYVTVGLRYEFTVGGRAFRVGIDNLLDARNETLKGFPAPGRTFFLHFGTAF